MVTAGEGKPMQQPFLPVSAWYTGGRVRAPLVTRPGAAAREEWRQDMERIAGCGFNSVRCWLDWASAEPAAGQLRTEALDLCLELAAEVGLRVVLQVYLDCAPDWVGRAYPDACFVSADGTAIDSQGSPGFCSDHPAVRAATGAFLERLAGRLAPQIAFYAWDLWSEPHVVNWAYLDQLSGSTLFCYCPYTAARFQGWLQARYQRLAELNEAWHRSFGAWDEVQPPRFTTLMTYTDRVDWLQFIMDKLAADLRWRHDQIRRADEHLTSSHSAVPSLITLPSDGYGSPDDWRMPQGVDVWGTSLYPKHVGAKETGAPFFRSAMLTSTRSASGGGPFWLGELQGGHGYVGTFAARVTGQDVAGYAWQCLAHGAKGMHFYAWYPMTSGLESAGFGLANLDGTPSDRAEAAGLVATVVGRNAGLFASARVPKAQAAICWNVYANLMWTALREGWHYVPSRSYVGAYKALYDGHLPAEFVHLDQFADGLAGYRLLHLPFGLMLTKAAASAAAEFAARGGTLLAEARTGWNDETGNCGSAVPGLGLDVVFGCREYGADLADPEQPVRIRIERAHPLLPGLSPGDEIAGAVFREVLEPADAGDVIAVFDDGSPAVVAHRHGAGWAVFAGSLLSLGYYRLGHPGTGRFLQGLAQAAGITPPVLVAPGEGIETHLLECADSGDHLLFVISHRDQQVSAELAVPCLDARCAVADLAGGPAVRPPGEDVHLRLTCSLPPRGVWVGHVVPPA
jgi:beta-galactosidase